LRWQRPAEPQQLEAGEHSGSNQLPAKIQSSVRAEAMRVAAADFVKNTFP
jgi:hypothetical protein